MTPAPQPPHSSKLRLHRQKTEPGHCFFVTKCLQPRVKILTGQAAAEIASALCFYAEHGHVRLAAFVVMPDHWHALFAPNGATLPTQMQSIGRRIGKQTNQHLNQHGCVWQDGYYETLVHTARQFEYVRQYIEENPVRAGLVNESEDWQWSSASLSYRTSITNPWPWHFDEEE